jgi:hypothetical protein
MRYMARRNGKSYISNIKQNRDSVAGMQIEQLNVNELETFQDRPGLGVLSKGSPIYRYGAVPQQAESSSARWVHFTEDWMEYSEQAVGQVALLDVVRPEAPRDPWNTAEWRAEFKAIGDIVVWFGVAGSMAFDTSEGLRYRGPGDLLPDLVRHGGGSQVLIHQRSLLNLELIDLVKLMLSRYLH